MADELGAELSLDLDAARREIESFRRDLEEELDRAVTSFADSYAETVGRLPAIEPEIDAGIVTTELSTAVADADTTVTPNLDSSTVSASLIDAVESVQPVATVTADTDAVATSLTDAVESVHPTVTPELDASEITTALDEIAASAGAGGEVAAGFDEAQLQAQDLADTLDQLQSQSTKSSDGLATAGQTASVLQAGFAGASGEGRKLIGHLSQLGGGFGPVIAGTAGAALGFTALFEAGERSVAAVERVQTVLGGAADQIEHIDVGGLSGDLGTLAVQAGVSGSALRNAAASAAQVGLASGATKGQVVEFANSVNALALRAVALNPALGDAGAVSERLNIALARGGRFLNRYGIDLNATEITLRALSNTGKASARDLTFFERSVAGAQLAVEQFNGSIGKDFERGTEQTSVQLKRLKAELASAFASAGKPLVKPTIDALDSLSGVATELSVVLGQVGTAAIPALQALFTTLGTLAYPLEGIALVLQHIPAPLLTAVVAFGAFRLAAGPISGLLERAGVAVVDFAANTRAVGTASEFVGNKVFDLGGRLDTSRANFAAAATGAILFSSSLRGMGENIEQTLTGIGGLALAGSQVGAIFSEPVLGAAIGAAVGGIVALGKSMFDAGDDAAKMADDVKNLVSELDGLGSNRAATTFADTTVGGLANLSAAFQAAGADTGAFVKDYQTSFGDASLSTDEAIRKIDKFNEEFALLAEKNPAQAKRVRDGLVAMGDAVPNKELNILSDSLAKGTAEAARHARNSQADAEANQKLGQAADGTTKSVDTQNKILEAAQQKLSAYAESAKGGTDASAELANTLSSLLSPKLDDIGKIFDDLYGSVQKFTGGFGAPDVTGYTETLTDTTQETAHWLDTIQFLFGQGLTGLAQLVLQRGPSLSKDLIDQIVNSSDGQRDAWNTSLAAGFTAFAENQERVKTEAAALAAKAAEGIEANPDDLLDAMRKKLAGVAKFSAEVQSLIAEGNTGIAAELLGLGADAGQKYIDGLNSKTPEERAALNAGLVATHETLTATQRDIESETVNVANASGTMAERLVAAYQSHLFKIPKSSDEAMLQALAIIYGHTPDFYRAGHGAGSQGGKGVADGLTEQQKNAEDATNNLAYGLEFLGPNFHGVGEGLGASLTTGIAAGINSDAAAREAQQAIDEQLDRLQAEAYSHVDGGSPAMAFAPLGRSIVQGVALGITSEAGIMASRFDAALDGLRGHPIHHGGGGLGLGAAPAPAPGASPFQVQVMLPSDLGGGSSVDNSVHDLIVNNYGPDRDVRASHLARQLRSHQFLNAGV